MEGVRGAETYIFDEQFLGLAPRQNTILPFTRNAVGPMDYTPVTFSDNRHPHLTTFGHELALSVVFESGLLHLADSDRAYRSLLPEEAAGVLSRVPAAWDETRCLTGTPGSHVVIARRRGHDWFVAGINGRPERTAVDLNLAELADGDTTWLVLRDGPRRDDLTAGLATAERPMSLVMAPHGGFLVTTSRG